MVKDTIEVIICKLVHKKALFLLLKRKKELGDFWQPVVGKVMHDEDHIAAVYRECFEEVGLERDHIVKFIDEFYTFVMNKHYLTGTEIPITTEHVYGIIANPDFKVEIGYNPDTEHIKHAWLEYRDALEKLKWNDNKTALQIFRSKHLQ